MDRRALLVALTSGLSLSGCVANSSSSAIGEQKSETDTPQNVEDRTQTRNIVTPPVSPSPRRITVAAIDGESLRSAFGVEASVKVIDGAVTASETARIVVDLRTSEETERRLTYEQTECRRNEFRASNGDYELFLFPADGEWTNDDAECPVVSYSNLSCGVPPVEETVTVPASGAVTWRYDAVVPPWNVDSGGCVVPGRYRFTREFVADEESATLSFDLVVAAADRYFARTSKSGPASRR